MSSSGLCLLAVSRHGGGRGRLCFSLPSSLPPEWPKHRVSAPASHTPLLPDRTMSEGTAEGMNSLLQALGSLCLSGLVQLVSFQNTVHL